MTVRPFPWSQVRSASRVASRAAIWAGARVAVEGLEWRSAAVGDVTEVKRRFAEPSIARVRVRRGETVAMVGLAWRVWRGLAEAALGPDHELAAPRAPTIAERAFAAAAVADVLVRAGIDGDVEISDELPAWRGDVLVVELASDGGVVVALPAVVPPLPPRALATLVAAVGARLPEVSVALALARGSVRGWRDVAVRDVIVVGPPAAALLVAKGAIPVALDAARARITVLTPYERNQVPADDLANDLDVPLAIVAGDVTMSARSLLELTPGQVLSLGRSLGGPVEVRAGARCLARGELVEIDGELGVRITELVDAAPAVVASRE